MIRNADIRKEFGSAVRKARLQLGLSQESLAERAELHRTYVTDVERGARNLSLLSISKLAHALEVSIWRLFSSNSHLLDMSYGAAKGPAILLIEDDLSESGLALKSFNKARLANPVHVVQNGPSALAFLQARQPPEHFLPLTLLDLNLRGTNSLEVLRQIRSNEILRSAPVVVLTPSPKDALLEQAMKLGADAYIVKPLDFPGFCSVTSRFDFHWSLINDESPE